jgi:predicted RNA-binding protein with PIN domain
MKYPTFNSKNFTVIEVETLYEDYTGKKIGYKFKAEYLYSKSQEGSIYHRISITSLKMKKGEAVTSEVTISCSPLNIDEKVVLVTADLMSQGNKQFCEFLSKAAFRNNEILEKSKDNE